MERSQALNFPQIPGYDCEAFLGAGATGEVYRARCGSRPVALKVLRRLAVNRNLLGYSLSRLRDLPQHPHVVEVADFGMEGKPLYTVTSLHVRELSDGGCEGHTILPQCGELEPAVAWALIRQICEGMAYLHRHGVVHASLNPRNVMVDSLDPPHLRVTDFGQGWVSEITHIDFSESFLHAPPEQLRQPQQMFEGQAQRWDVYAFGVTAYRLLHGTFPRGQSWIDAMRQGRAAFHPNVYADLIAGESAVGWPDPKDIFAERRHQLLDRCLSLAPAERHTDLREVLAAFEEIDRDENLTLGREEAEHRERALTRQVAAGRQRQERWRRIALAFLAGLVLSVILNLTSESRLLGQRRDFHALEVESAKTLGDAKRREREAREDAARLRSNLTYAQSTADAFLEFLLNAKNPNSPEYQSVEGYLNSARRHYERVLEATEGDETLAVERLRAKLGQARIELQAGEREAGVAMLEDLVSELRTRSEAETGAIDVEETLAAALLELGRAQMVAGPRDAALQPLGESVKIYNRQVSAAPKNLPLRRKFGKALFFYGQQLSRTGDLSTALRSLQSAMQILETLAQSQDAREEDDYYLARCQFEVGLIRVWENQGIEAFEAFQLASRGYSRLMDEKPQVAEYRFQLARCLYYLGELSFQEKGDAEDSKLARRSMRELLLLLLKKDEGNRNYQFHLALALVDLAEMARDGGERETAVENLEQALTILSELHKETPKDTDITFHLALASAARGDLLLDAQETEKALQKMARAEALLAEIDAGIRKPSIPKHVYEFRRAALAGAHGHALEVDDQDAAAARCFERSHEILKVLAAERPDDSRIQDALQAIRTRRMTQS